MFRVLNFSTFEVYSGSLYSKLGLLQEEVPTLIRGDNKGSIVMAKNPQFHKTIEAYRDPLALGVQSSTRGESLC